MYSLYIYFIDLSLRNTLKYYLSLLYYIFASKFLFVSQFVVRNRQIKIANSRYKMKDIQGIILAHVLSDHIQAANGNFSKMHSWLAMINRPM
jgi:hypothetical protein